MRKSSVLTVVVLATLVTTTLWAATRIPADAAFRDASFTDIDGNAVYTDMVRSDGQRAYQDGIFCVNSSVSANQYFLRTVKSGCSGALVPRALTLDFRRPVTPPDDCAATDAYVGGTLNLCGANSVADVRVLAISAFSSSAVTL